MDRLSTVKRRFHSALVVGPEGEAVASAVKNAGLARETETLWTLGIPENEVLDARPGAHDLVICLLCLHETNDTPGVLIQMRHALKPDGLLMAAIPGGDSLHELRASLLAAEIEIAGGAHMRVLPFMDVRDAGGLLQRCGYALPVTDTDRLTIRYRDTLALMRDLRAMGATSTLADRPRIAPKRSLFAVAEGHYRRDHAAADGRLPMTVELIWMSGWAPDESQQKPLKPGSAQVSLTSVLGSRPDEGN